MILKRRSFTYNAPLYRCFYKNNIFLIYEKYAVLCLKSRKVHANNVCWLLLLDFSIAICYNYFVKLALLVGNALKYGLFSRLVGSGEREMKYSLIDIKSTHYDDKTAGGLSFFEGERDVPFKIRRIYWIYEAEKGTHRGFHAHTLNWQLLFCPYGSIDIILDDGHEREKVTLDSPSKGLVLSPGLWREMIWNKTGSVLCVAASEYYDPDEYIRDYDKFIEYVKNKESEQ